MNGNDARLGVGGRAFLEAYHRGAEADEAMEAALAAYRGTHSKRLGVPAWANAIVASVAAEASVTVADIRGRRSWVKGVAITPLRHRCVWLIRQVAYPDEPHGRVSWPAIGEAVNRDHASCVSAYRAFEKRLARDPELARIMEPHRTIPRPVSVMRPVLMAV